MGAFGGIGGSVFGGAGNLGSQYQAGVPLGSGIIMPAYRIAGITQRAMIIPSADMYAEAIPELNRMLGAWNCDGQKIFTTSIAGPFALTEGQKVYTLGPGAQIDMPRPTYIRGANVLLPTNPVVRRPVKILDDEQWRHIIIQDIPGAPPYQLYYDGGMNDSGVAQIYLRFQPPAGYSLELYTWSGLRSNFTTPNDVAVFPPGYEQALVYNLAKQLAALNPHSANMSPASYDIADRSLRTLRTLNTKSPRAHGEPGLGYDDIGPGYGWLDRGLGE